MVKSSLLILILLCGTVAEAKKRVVVEKIGGRGARDVQAAVEEVARRENDLVKPADFRRVAKRKRVSLRSDKGVARVAKEMGVDAIVSGTLKRVSRKAYKLTLAVREGRSGGAVEAVSVALASPKPDAAAKEQIAKVLLVVLAKTPSAAATEEPVVEVSPTETKTPAAAESSEDTEMAPTRAELPTTVIPEAKTEEVAVTATTQDELLEARRFRYGGADVSLGVGFLKRDLSFTSFDALAPAQRPNGYKGGTPVIGAAVAGEVYPLSFGSRGGLVSGFGVGFAFERVFVLKSKLGTTEYDTTATGYGFGLRYRYNFGSSPKAPSVKLMVGWNHLNFTIDRGADDIDLPNVSYSYLDLGVGARVPLTVPWLALFADFSWLPVLSSGEISDSTWYGGGSTTGIALDGGAEVRIKEAWVIRGGVRYRRIAFDFDGTGDKSVNRDGNTATQDVGGALDEYLTGYLLLGYVF